MVRCAPWLLSLVAVLALSCGGGSTGASEGDSGPPSDASLADQCTGCGGDAGDASDDHPTAPIDAAPPPGDAAWIMPYYAGYDASRLTVSEIDWSRFTHLAVAFYLPDLTGGLDESLFIDATNGPKLGHSLVAAAHANGRKILASIGGAGEHDKIASSASAANRAAFVARIAKLVADYGYDGVDLDWEPIQPGDPPSILALAEALRGALPSGTLLTIPVDQLNANAIPSVSYLAGFAPVFDRISIMSYGMSGAYQGWKSWHSSPLHWNHVHETPAGIDVSVDAILAAGVPPRKLGVGAGFYGLCYGAPVTAPVQALAGATTKDVIYADIVASYLAPSPGARQWDDGAKVPYLTFAAPRGPDACEFLSYEDAQSLGEKAAYAKGKGLGAIIVWQMNQGYLAGAPAGQRHPLLTALGSAFLP